MTALTGAFPADSMMRCPFAVQIREEGVATFFFRSGEQHRISAADPRHVEEIGYFLTCVVHAALKTDRRDAPYSVSPSTLPGHVKLSESVCMDMAFTLTETEAADDVIPLLNAGVRCAHQWMESDRSLGSLDVRSGQERDPLSEPEETRWLYHFYVPNG